MRRILSLLLMLTVGIVGSTAQGLWMNRLMDDFTAHGAKVSVSRINDKFHLSRRWNVAFDRDLPLANTVCIVLDSMARHAVESYRYECHRNGNDTITYSIAMRGYGNNDDYVLDLTRVADQSSTWTNDYNDFKKSHAYLYRNPYMQQERNFYNLLQGNNRRMYFGAREAVMFDYVQGHGNLIAMATQLNEAQGTYYHFVIAPLDSLLSTLNARKTPVHYRHEAGQPVDKATTYYYTDYLLPKSKGQSESRGTLYVVKADEGAAALYRTLLDAANRHLDENPTQCCVLEYTDRHFKLSGVRNTTKLLVNEIAESSFLMADLDRDGTLYVLRLEVDGEYWIPKNWKQ